MIISKKTTNTTPDGALTLFQLPHDYVAGSVIVFEKLTNTEVKGLDINELGGSYIETLSIPGDGSVLIILYDYNDESIELASTTLEGFKPWDSKRLIALIEQITILGQAVEAINKSLKNKVSKEELQTIFNPIYEEIKSIKLAHSSF